MVTGHLLGTLTSWIVEYTSTPDLKSFCIGHSLGAHVCGFAGKTRRLTGIIGLDPAGPIFEDNSEDARLNRNDADIVYAIHTNTAWLGIWANIGDIDYYPNGGKTQPGCKSSPWWSHDTFAPILVSELMVNQTQEEGSDAHNAYTLVLSSQKECNNQQDAEENECREVVSEGHADYDIANLENIQFSTRDERSLIRLFVAGISMTYCGE